MKNHAFSIVLLLSILAGGLLGFWLGPDAIILKPFGDLFFNLISTLVVPLVFFTIASSIASMGDNFNRLENLIAKMLAIFLFTGVVSAILGLIAVGFFPLAEGLSLPTYLSHQPSVVQDLGSQLVSIVSVSNFQDLLSRQHMLALVIFSMLVGIAIAYVGEKAKPFAQFLNAGSAIWMTMVHFIMYYAPIGLAAYFAVLVSELDSTFLSAYAKIAFLYYALSVVYVVIGFSGYAYSAGKQEGVIAFWKHALAPILTALGTCSSAASIPVNLEAAEKIGIPKSIRETTLPFGASIHKDGSVIGGMFKIAVLFSLFQQDFFTPSAMITALLVSLLVGTVMGAIPGGGLIGEMLILSVYGFPKEALPIIAAISTIIDPPATVLNSTGNIATSMMIARWVEGENWMKAKIHS